MKFRFGATIFVAMACLLSENESLPILTSVFFALWCWTTIHDKFKRRNADLEKLEEDTATTKQLLSTPIKDAWYEDLREMERDIGTNRAPIFWEKFFERRDIINAHRAKAFNLSEIKRKLQTNRLIFRKTVCVELPPKEEISAWFHDTDSVFYEMKQRVLENPIFHVAYIAMQQARKQDAHNQRMESIARKTEKNTAKMAKTAKATRMTTTAVSVAASGATTVN